MSALKQFEDYIENFERNCFDGGLETPSKQKSNHHKLHQIEKPPSSINLNEFSETISTFSDRLRLAQSNRSRSLKQAMAQLSLEISTDEIENEHNNGTFYSDCDSLSTTELIGSMESRVNGKNTSLTMKRKEMLRNLNRFGMEKIGAASFRSSLVVGATGALTHRKSDKIGEQSSLDSLLGFEPADFAEVLGQNDPLALEKGVELSEKPPAAPHLPVSVPLQGVGIAEVSPDSGSSARSRDTLSSSCSGDYCKDRIAATQRLLDEMDSSQWRSDWRPDMERPATPPMSPFFS